MICDIWLISHCISKLILFHEFLRQLLLSSLFHSLSFYWAPFFLKKFLFFVILHTYLVCFKCNCLRNILMDCLGAFCGIFNPMGWSLQINRVPVCWTLLTKTTNTFHILFIYPKTWAMGKMKVCHTRAKPVHKGPLLSFS